MALKDCILYCSTAHMDMPFSSRYLQRFDPGFGFSGGPYTIQPMYAPAVNYNTEFPQLGANQLPPISSEHQHRPLPQHLPGPWIGPSAPAGIGYGPAEIATFNSGHVNAQSNSGLYLHSPQYPCQRSGLPYLHPLDPVHQSFSQVCELRLLCYLGAIC